MNLIQTYGTIENIYVHLADIAPKLAEKLELGREDVFFSKKLIELMQVPQIQGLELKQRESNKDIHQRESILI